MPARVGQVKSSSIATASWLKKQQVRALPPRHTAEIWSDVDKQWPLPYPEIIKRCEKVEMLSRVSDAESFYCAMADRGLIQP